MAEGIVSQYIAMYCDQIGHEAVELCRDTRPRHGHARRSRPATRPPGPATRAGQAATRSAVSPLYGPARAAWAHLGAQVGQAVHLMHPTSF